MSQEPASGQSGTSLFHEPPPGYWKTKKRLNRLVRFRNLVIHRERWGPDLDSALALDELFPGENLKENAYETLRRVEREITEQMALVFNVLRRCGVQTRVSFSRSNFADNFLGQSAEKKERVEYDLILDFFNVPRDVNWSQNMEALLQRLDMGIGIHKTHLPQAKWDLFNPAMWMAYIIRLPITVLERAGMMSHPTTQEKFLTVYAWVVQFATLALILIVAGHYGAKIPWSNIFSYVIKAIPGVK
jgi:hypothetical protein